MHQDYPSAHHGRGIKEGSPRGMLSANACNPRHEKGDRQPDSVIARLKLLHQGGILRAFRLKSDSTWTASLPQDSPMPLSPSNQLPSRNLMKLGGEPNFFRYAERLISPLPGAYSFKHESTR